MNTSSRVGAWPFVFGTRVFRPVGRVQGDHLALVQDRDPVAQPLGLVHVVRGQDDGRVVALADLAHEGLHVALRVRVEPGRRLVEQEERGRREEAAGDGDLLLHPARHPLHRLGERLLLEPQAQQDLAHLPSGLRHRHPVQAGGVGQVLQGRELLEEGGVDRDPVDQPLHGELLLLDVVAEHADRAAVREEERRDEADERRLPRAVGAEDAEDLPPLDGEVQGFEGDDVLLPVRVGNAPGKGPLLAREDLAHALQFKRRWQHERLLDERDNNGNRPTGHKSCPRGRGVAPTERYSPCGSSFCPSEKPRKRPVHEMAEYSMRRWGRQEVHDDLACCSGTARRVPFKSARALATEVPRL